jgi:hypothetical protein
MRPASLKSASLDFASLDFASLDFASLLNIAHLHVRFARQASERDRSARRDRHPHAAQAGAIDLDILRHR